MLNLAFPRDVVREIAASLLLCVLRRENSRTASTQPLDSFELKAALFKSWQRGI